MTSFRWTWVIVAIACTLIVVSLYFGPGPFLLVVAAIAILLAVLNVYAAGIDLAGLLVADGGAEPPALAEPEVRSDIAAPRLRRELAIAGLHEIAQEHELGKISDDDYKAIEEAYRIEARRLVQDEDTVLSAARKRAEEYLASRPRQAEASREGSPEGGEPSSGPAVQAKGAATKCAQCGVGNDADARFCKHCGTSLLPT